MSVNLTKGQKVSLTKENPGLKTIVVGLGWDEAKPKAVGGSGLFGGLFSRVQSVENIDCDASAILLQNGRYMGREDLVYFGNLNHASGAVHHNGDNLTGAGEGDDEQIEIDLTRVPQKYDKIVIVVNIYAAYHRKQDFGMIDNAFVRIVDKSSGKELLRYNLTEEYPGMTGMVFGEVYRYNNEWKFSAIGQGTRDGSVSEMAKRYAKSGLDLEKH